jgi:D-arabinose 1-dehydrogenase-like Zn-dependent alcohol dehydrogenase
MRHVMEQNHVTILGHEGIGLIKEAGEGTRVLKAGERASPG